MGWFRKDDPRLVRIDEVMHYRTGGHTTANTAGTNNPTDTTTTAAGTGVESWSGQTTDTDQQWGSVGATWLVDDHPAAVEALADGFDSWGVN